MISKTQISKRTKRKTKSELVETILLAKKNNLLDLAKKLSGPTRLQSKINLSDLNKSKENKIIVAGKVLSKGEINRKIEIAALGFSESAKNKLEKSNSKIMSIKLNLYYFDNYFNMLSGIPSLKYLARVIQLLENSGIVARIEPPTQTEKVLSLGAIILKP